MHAQFYIAIIIVNLRVCVFPVSLNIVPCAFVIFNARVIFHQGDISIDKTWEREVGGVFCFHSFTIAYDTSSLFIRFFFIIS